MEYVDELDPITNKTVRSYSIDEYGNKEIIYDELGEDADFNIFEALVSRCRLELRINKELYTNGYISKELYEKIEIILLDRVKPFTKYVEI